MPFATAPDGVKLYYETVGTGEPLLLVAGQGGDHHQWDELREDFAKDYQVIVYDHRGTGQSDKPESPPYSTRGFAQDAIAILDDLGIERTQIYGVSMGGRIGQWLAIDYPERIGAAVLGCTTPGNAHGVRRPPEIDALMGKGDVDALLAILVSPEWMESHPEFLAKWQERSMDSVPPYAQRLHYRASEDHDAWERLPEIQAPTLVIHGSDDQLNMTANAYLLAERIPNAELYIVAGGRHGFFIEFRAEASSVVLDFLAKHRLPQ